MKRSLFIVLAFLGLLVVYPACGYSQPGYYRGGYGYGMGLGMMDSYGGYGMGQGMMGSDWIDVPDNLPAPQNKEWVQKLREILTLEKKSFAQFQADQEKFNSFMPYMMVVPQLNSHIDWIGQLFAAYGMISPAYRMPDDGTVPPVKENKTLTEAYELGAEIEKDLTLRLEWLVKKAEDHDSAYLLNIILLQSRWHQVLFDHVLKMGGYGGYGMRHVLMSGQGYGIQHYKFRGKSIDFKEAKAMMNAYLKSTRNPNLKIGKIRDIGKDFEAELVTKENSVVDKIHIDKNTGRMRSAYLKGE